MNLALLVPPHDTQSLAAIHAQCFAEPWTDASIATSLGKPGVYACGGAYGFVLMRVAADEAEILTLAVVPAARRRGIASALVAMGAREAFERGAKNLFLEVDLTNAAARTLYGRLGFVEVARRKGYYSGGGDACVLRANLPLPEAATRPQREQG